MGEIRLIKDNVERIVFSEAAACKLEIKGFERLNSSAIERKTEKPVTKMTVKELRILAKERGIAEGDVLKKDELIQILEGEENDKSRKTEETDGRE